MATRKRPNSPVSFKIGNAKYDELFEFLKSSDSSSLRNSKVDNTIISVMRVLLKDRISSFTISSGKACAVVQDVSFDSYKNEAGIWPEDVFYSDYDFRIFKSGIGINLVKDSTSDSISECHKYDERFKESGWIRMEDIEAFVSKDPCAIYQSVSNQAVYALIPFKSAISCIHKLVSCMPRLFSWAFENYPITEDERNMLNAISNSDFDLAEKYMEKLFDFAEIEKKEILRNINGISCAGIENEIRQRTENIKSSNRDIDSYMQTISELEDRIFQENAIIAALLDKKNSDEADKELAEFIFANSAIQILRRFSAPNGNIRYAVLCYLDDCDERLYNKYIVENENARSYIFSYSRFDLAITKDLFMSIFGQHRFNIRTYCEWSIDSKCRVSAIEGTSLEGHYDLMENRIPQPHIDRYGCYSGYKGILADLERKRDFIGAMSTTVGSSHSINWTDSTVVSSFMRNFFGSDSKFLEDGDGNLYTVDEVVEILKAEKEAAKTAETAAEVASDTSETLLTVPTDTAVAEETPF